MSIFHLKQLLAPALGLTLLSGPLATLASQCIDLPTHRVAIDLPLKLAVWNTAKLNHPKATPFATELINSHQLVLFQETLQRPIFSGLQASNYRSFAPGFTFAGLQTGVSAWATTPPLTECKLSTSEPWVLTPKASLISKYPISDEDNTTHRLAIANIHAINFVTDHTHYQLQLNALISILNKHQGPSIIAGDFNTWSLTRTKIMNKTLKQAGYKSVQFTPDLRSRPFLGLPLDHVWYKGLQVIDASTKAVNSSDHNPMFVQFGKWATTYP